MLLRVTLSTFSMRTCRPALMLTNKTLYINVGAPSCLYLPHAPLVRSMSSKSEQDNHRSAYKPRADPTAKRPTQKCDPYGQGGKPMSKAEAKLFKSTTHEDWKLEFGNTDYPIAIFREFVHSDFLLGARFLQKIAAVAELNAHFPSICLERRIVKKNWQVFSRIRCHTRVLEGLSANDFHLAMLIDVETSRPEFESLLILASEA